MPKSSVQQYQEFEEYTNYIDTSDVMLGFYKHEHSEGLEKYFLMIQQWLDMQHQNPQNNLPLVIQGDGGVGKKTLLVKWFQYHQTIKQKNRHDLTILHFATTGGNNSNYFYAIYRILIKLREQLNIEQKVQLHQQKIRKYFSYWLDICNQKIINQNFQNFDQMYSKIIIVLEGIDYFVDRGNGKQGNIAFWLPKYFPKNVKVIVTADGQSQSMKYFTRLNCQKMMIPSDSILMKSMIKRQQQKQLYVKDKTKQKLLSILTQIIDKKNVSSLFVKSYLSCLLPKINQNDQLKSQSISIIQQHAQSIDFQQLYQLSNIQELFYYLLEFWGKKFFQNQLKFKEVIGILISTQKGLTRSEIIQITNISDEQLKIFIILFRSFLMNFKDLWMIKNDCFKKAINIKYTFNWGQLSSKIADTLKKSPNSVRKLQEQTYHLYTTGNYFKLKEVVSDIENFLLLFNPYTKYDLCRYWQKLQQKYFDPVIEYNKAIQGFEMHYHPTSDDLFRIITQISRFFKEFSDFQTYYTPQFRHPKIVGNLIQLQDIGILNEFINLSMCQDITQNFNKLQNKKYDEILSQNNDINEQQAKLKKKIRQMYEKIQKGKHIKKLNKLEISTQDNNTANKKVEKKKKSKLLTIQQANIEVKSNQDNFRKYYYQLVQPFISKYFLTNNLNHANQLTNNNQQYYDSDKQDINSINHQNKIKSIQQNKQKQKSKLQQIPYLKTLYIKTVQQQFSLNQKPPTNYYYKRWIWMQFPWVCMTIKCDYSDKLCKCFTSPTSYMSVSKQRQFTLQALKIALQAKRKKQQILEKPQQLPNPLKRNQTLGQLSITNKNISKQLKQNQSISKIYTSGLTFNSKIKKKIQELPFITNSFLSLSNLQKQMENINKDKNKNKIQANSEEKNSLFITQGDKTCQQYSSLLHSMSKKKKKQNINQTDLSIPSKSRHEGLLPRIKQNVNKQIMNQLQLLQKNNINIRKQVDNYLFKNKILAKKLKQLKIIQQNQMNQIKNQKKINDIKKKISQLQIKIQKVKNNYAFSLLQYQRLNMLIKICQQNKTQNQQTIPNLVFQCNNMKKMINIQKSSINDLNKKTEQTKKLIKRFLQNTYQRVKNENNLNQQIQQTYKNRQCFHGQVSKYDEMILQQVQIKKKQFNILAKSIHKKNEQQKNIQKHRSIHHSQQQQNYQIIYYQILQHLNIKDDSYKTNPKYIQLLQALYKKKQLQTINEQRKIQLQDLQKQYNNQKRDLLTLAKAQGDVEQIRKNKQHHDQKYQNQIYCPQNKQTLLKKLQQKNRNLNKIMSTKLSCLGILNTWYIRMGLSQQNDLIITPQFVQNIKNAQI